MTGSGRRRRGRTVATRRRRPRRAARRPDRCAICSGRASAPRPSPKPAGQLGAARPRRVLRCALRFRPVPRQHLDSRHRAGDARGDRHRRPAARKRGAARLRPSCRSPRALAEHAGARRPRRRPASWSRCWLSRAGGDITIATSLAARWPTLRARARSPGAALAGCRIEAPRRIDDSAGREHGADARRRARRVRALGDAAQPQRR